MQRLSPIQEAIYSELCQLLSKATVSGLIKELGATNQVKDLVNMFADRHIDSEDYNLTDDELQNKYTLDDEAEDQHPVLTKYLWRKVVRERNTDYGYWYWVYSVLKDGTTYEIFDNS